MVASLLLAWILAIPGGDEPMPFVDVAPRDGADLVLPQPSGDREAHDAAGRDEASRERALMVGQRPDLLLRRAPVAFPARSDEAQAPGPGVGARCGRACSAIRS
jgi:hypothetical protein